MNSGSLSKAVLSVRAISCSHSLNIAGSLTVTSLKSFILLDFPESKRRCPSFGKDAIIEDESGDQVKMALPKLYSALLIAICLGDLLSARGLDESS